MPSSSATFCAATQNKRLQPRAEFRARTHQNTTPPPHALPHHSRLIGKGELAASFKNLQYFLCQLVPELQFAQDPPKIISGWTGRHNFYFSNLLIFQHSDSLLADRPAVQCWTCGCVETTHNQVNQSKPSYPSLNQVNQTKPKSQAYANHGNHGDHLHSRKPWKHSNNRKSLAYDTLQLMHSLKNSKPRILNLQDQ